jgi:hypothetical protein
VLIPDITSQLTPAAANRLWLQLGALALCGMAGPAMCALGPEPAQTGACNARIILALKQPMQPPPTDQWVHSLAAANAVELHYLRAMTARLYLFRLNAADDATCSAPIARLRRDSRLRSAELDQHRKHDAG